MQNNWKKFPVLKKKFSGDAKKLPTDCRTNGCGKGANCQLKDGGYICQCPPGTIGSPLKECTLGKCLYIYFENILGSTVLTVHEVKFNFYNYSLRTEVTVV